MASGLRRFIVAIMSAPAVLLGRVASLPGVTTVEQQHIVVAALGPCPLDDGGNAVEAAHLAVTCRQSGIVIGRQCIGFRRARLDLVELQEIRAGHVRRKAGNLADADVDGRLAEKDRLELRVNVGDVKQRDVAEFRRAQQIVFVHRLLRRRPRPAPGHRRTRYRRKRDGRRQEFAS